MAVQKKVDVVTIGAGWTAAILAWKLCEAGFRVTSIEQGPGRWANPGFVHNHDSLRYGNRYAMMVNLRKETWTWRPTPQDPSLPMRQYGSFNPGQGLGGAAVHWSAQLWRFYPYEFRLRSHILERYGPDKLPPNSTIKDWPVSYDELEPYYSEFEWDIGASGDETNPFGPPRSRGFPNPPLAYNIPAVMFSRAAAELGYNPFPFHSGISSQAFIDRFGNVRGGCLYCGYCTRYGCEVDAKSSPLTTHLPVALRTGLYEVRTMSKVLSVNMSRDGMATGVTYLDENGEEQVQPADMVAFTAFTLENVHMLLVSRGSPHPNGIGNDRGQVGKNYTYQIFQGDWRGYFPGRRFNLFTGNSANRAAMHDFYGDNFDHSDLPFYGGAQIWSSPAERHPDGTASDYPIGGEKKWGREWKEALRNQWNSSQTIVIEGDSLPYQDNFLNLDPIYRDTWGRPLLRLTFDWHPNEYALYRFLADKCIKIMDQMGPAATSYRRELHRYNIANYQSTHPTGGAIMGFNPGDSVTNSYGQVWDTPNVFVFGAALFPQNPGANPTDTVAALAYRTGNAIRDRYFKDPGRLLS